jgi:hypothetical protein
VIDAALLHDVPADGADRGIGGCRPHQCAQLTRVERGVEAFVGDPEGVGVSLDLAAQLQRRLGGEQCRHRGN